MAVEMKDTGIEWIGKIPKEWDVSKLKYTSNFVNGDRSENYPSPNEFVDEGVLFVTSNNIHEQKLDLDAESKFITQDKYKKLRGAKLEKNDLIYCLRGSVGLCSINKTVDAGTIASSLVAIKPKTINADYLSYLMQSEINSFQTSLYTNGSCAANLSAENVANYYCIEPSIYEQKLIADFLDKQTAKIDAIIKTNEEQLKILKKYKKSLITQTVTKGLNKNVKMKDSGVDWIGKIPYNWEIQRLKYVLTKNNSIRVGPFGTALTTSDYTDEGQWVYNQRVVLDKNFMENDTFISEEKAKELKGFKVFSGDLLITTRGTIGKVAKVPENCKDGVLHPCIIRFRVEEGKLPYKLINVLFNESDFVLDQITRFSNATTIDVIYSETLKNLIVPIIPQDELTVITSYLDKQCTKINCLINKKQQAIDTMQKYKKSLIYEYVTGKKRIK